MYSHWLWVCLCVTLGAVLPAFSGRGDTHEVVASIEGTTTVTTTARPTTKRTKIPYTGPTSRKQKRRPSHLVIKRNRHVTKISKRSLRSTRDPLTILAYRLNYTATGRTEIIGYREMKQHVELFTRGGFRVYIEDDGVRCFGFLGNINKPIYDTILTPSPYNPNVREISELKPDYDMFGVTRESINGKWIYENRTVTLRNGDTVNYRLLIANLDGSYRVKVRQYFIVRSIDGFLVPEVPGEEKQDKYYVDFI